MSVMDEATPRLMIVDDTLDSLQVLEEMLTEQGYRVLALPDGEMALKAASRRPPDLILLDVLMPGLDGFQVCARLKADAALRDVPVLFLSALSAPGDKVRAFKAGAVDYITKPFQFEEVEARVSAHLRLRHLQQELAAHSEALESTVRQRTEELVEANARLAELDQAKSDFLSIVAHELRTPLNGLFNWAEMMLTDLPSTADTQECSRGFAAARRRILSLIDDAMLLARLQIRCQAIDMHASDLAPILAEAVDAADAAYHAVDVAIGPAPTTTARVHGQHEMVVRAVRALLVTATRFALPGSTVRLTLTPDDLVVRMAIEASGYAVPELELARFFEVFAIGRTLTPGGDVGLAPALGRCLIRASGGQVAIENLDPPGVRITVLLRRLG